MVLMDDGAVMVVGGKQNEDISANTFLYDIGSGVWSNGPVLFKARY
jgi:hypothetical protein